MCIKVYELDPAHFLSAPGLVWQACFKNKTDVELELLTDPDKLLIIEKGIRGGICHAIHRYAKANNKYIKNYDENEESSFLESLDENNLYGRAMSERLPVNGFKWIEDLSKIDEDFIKNCNKDSDKGYIFEVDIEYLKNLHDLHSDLPFLPERIKIDKCNNLVCNLYDKKSYVARIRSLKWFKSYTDMNTELRKQAKNDFKKLFFKLMNKSAFGKTMENVRKHRDIKLVTTEKRRNKLVSEPNYHTKKWFSENL